MSEKNETNIIEHIPKGRSLKWYYENREKVLLKRKEEEKMTCIYCNKTFYKSRLLMHETSKLHKKRKEQYDQYMTIIGAEGPNPSIENSNGD